MYDGVRYYAVRTNPRCERRAVRDLKAAGFGFYLPTETHLKKLPARLYAPKARANREEQRIETALMPGYLFVQVDYPRQSFDAIRACNGVHSLVGIGNAPTAIAGTVIWRLMEAEASGEFDHTPPAPPVYRADDRVKIIDGPLKGFAAKVKETSPDGRIWVVFDSGALKGAVCDAGQVERAA